MLLIGSGEEDFDVIIWVRVSTDPIYKVKSDWGAEFSSEKSVKYSTHE